MAIYIPTPDILTGTETILKIFIFKKTFKFDLRTTPLEIFQKLDY